MSGFQRFVSYINLYEDNHKIRNVGFAKIEKQGGQCKIEIHLKGTGYTQIACPIYLFVRKKEKIEGISIGKIQVVNGTGVGNFLLQEDNLSDSGYGMEQVGGFLIFVTEQIMFASEWDDKEILRETFIALETKQPVENTEIEDKKIVKESLGEELKAAEAVLEIQVEQDREQQSRMCRKGKNCIARQIHSHPEKQLWTSLNTGTKTQFQEEKGAQANIQSSLDVSPTSQLQQDREKQPDLQPSINIDPTSQLQPDREKQPDLQPSTNTAPTLQEEPEPPWEQRWQFILENYPVLTPFEGEENILCVRMDLKDLRLLPKCYWYLGNNSFLLHGYFNYRYFILGAMEAEGKKRWFVGVPGIYQSQEKVMAAIFGFSEYRSEKETEQKTGQFGYWYRFLND